MRLAVIGTGYVGLVTGACLADAGHDVVCMDIDEGKVAKLKKGVMPIYEPGLQDVVLKNVGNGRLRFTTSLKELGGPAAIFFALPTPPMEDGGADLSYLLSAAKDTARVLKSYTVLIDKSTVPVGTTVKVREIIEAETKMPFDVVSNPEFLREGYAVADFMNANRIVVGTSSPKARKVMEDLYRPFTDNGVPLIMMDEASAEMTKYAANSFLATKISFMNEIANLCELVGADVDMVRQGIGSDERIGHRFLQAGIGYGGSCFPKDVLALQRSAHLYHYHLQILDAAMAVNGLQKEVMVNKVIDRLGKDLHGKTLAVWGLAFKANTDDMREAPSLEIIGKLMDLGAAIRAYDPQAMDNARRYLGDSIQYAANAFDALKGADALLVLTEWEEFKAADLKAAAKRIKNKLIFDGRNIYDPDNAVKAGFTYVGIGRGVKRSG